MRQYHIEKDGKYIGFLTREDIDGTEFFTTLFNLVDNADGHPTSLSDDERKTWTARWDAPAVKTKCHLCRKESPTWPYIVGPERLPVIIDLCNTCTKLMNQARGEAESDSHDENESDALWGRED